MSECHRPGVHLRRHPELVWHLDHKGFRIWGSRVTAFRIYSLISVKGSSRIRPEESSAVGLIEFSLVG